MADSSPESLCDLEPMTSVSGPGLPFSGALGGASLCPDFLMGSWQDCGQRKGFPALLSTAAPEVDMAPFFR